MQDCEPLAWDGILTLLIMTAFIFMPSMRHRTDLLTCWNAMLTGVAVRVGIGGLEAAIRLAHRSAAPNICVSIGRS